MRIETSELVSEGIYYIDGRVIALNDIAYISRVGDGNSTNLSKNADCGYFVVFKFTVKNPTGELHPTFHCYDAGKLLNTWLDFKKKELKNNE